MSRNGWDFYSKLVGSDIATRLGNAYVDKVENEIEKLVNELLSLKSRQTDAQLGGFVAECWHAGTFNINAIASGSAHSASTLGSTEYGSVDIATNFGKNISSKYMTTAEQSLVQQALYNRDLEVPKYIGQERLIPTDQIEEASEIAAKRVAKNALTRPKIAESYNDAGQNLVDRVSDGNIESNPLTKKGSKDIARDIKNDELDINKYGVNTENTIKTEYIIQNAIKAGATTAVITMALQVTPELIKVINHLVKTKQLDLQQVKKLGLTAITSSTEGFLRGSISCALLIAMESGKFGAMFKNVNPTVLASVVSIVLETVKNSILVASSRMSKREMGMKFVDSVVISTGFMACMSIGGKIGAMVGFQAPIVGYIIGSLLGCTVATLYQIGKNKIISICIETGFTCFGLVEQNYELPEEYIKELGIDIAVVNRAIVNTNQVNIVEVNRTIVNNSNPLICYKVLKRGLIGVNKIGYVYE